jgi:hypothetical protein
MDFVLPNLLQCSNALLHDWDFWWSVKDLFDGNRCGSARINDALTIVNGCESATIVNDTLIFLNDQ